MCVRGFIDDRSDAFITLPGGFGTLEEVLEIMTLRQLAYHDKPIVIVNIGGYFDPLLRQFEHIFAEGFAQSLDRGVQANFKIDKCVVGPEQGAQLVTTDDFAGTLQ